MTLPKMRTISEVHNFVKSQDKDSSINEYRIRQLCKDNKIRYIKVGVKYLIDLDSFVEYFIKSLEHCA